MSEPGSEPTSRTAFSQPGLTGDSIMGQLAGGGSCREALETLYHFLDGEMTPDRRAAIQAHLDQCSPCLEAFDFESELKMLIARCCRDQVPDSLRIRVAALLARASATGDQPV
ncbi:MAG: mycothiol system anti-sigma-R factor [Acidimicrobiales bacterium]